MQSPALPGRVFISPCVSRGRHHVSPVKIPREYVADEIKACGDVVRSVTGYAPRFFRPPGGEYDRRVAEASEALGYTMALWTDDPGDYASPGEEVILRRTLDSAAPGGILLLHDGVGQTVAVLPRLIRERKARGYEAATSLSPWIARPPDRRHAARLLRLLPPVEDTNRPRVAAPPATRLQTGGDNKAGGSDGIWVRYAFLLPHL